MSSAGLVLLPRVSAEISIHVTFSQNFSSLGFKVLLVPLSEALGLRFRRGPDARERVPRLGIEEAALPRG